MSNPLAEVEPLIRVGVFLGIFLAMAVWQRAGPRRPEAISPRLRWTNNLCLVSLDVVLARVLVPVGTVELALAIEARGIGLFNWLQAPSWVAVPVALVVMDLALYLQHRVFHALPVLWRLHRVHHADLEVDVTTGLRFHPLEIIVSLLIKLALVIALGAPAIAVLCFDVILNASSMFNHGNVRIPSTLDRLLRRFVVTPDMHRIHHSVLPNETNSNFGFNLTWWDRLLGTYRAEPRDGQETMTLGLAQFRTPRDLWIDRMLLQPLRGEDDPPAPGARGPR